MSTSEFPNTRKKKGLKIEPTEIHLLLERVLAEGELASFMLLLADLNSLRCLGMAAVEVRN